ncbi:hypothetical protein [Planobispora longispora]|uniref:Uncharacterized protein n=1 Tax=Planobispora longispora TaxID=28887 RepID=A0A8J3RU10_9ACTN|nr:hypothetical protein [Planobispora longispora]BFE79443.1 hypothetical protein GCM10020093_020440 [Planobispora longispora]GIH78223.1 hypothetical protein Plo01_46520 [Planobispora longispora]
MARGDALLRTGPLPRKDLARHLASLHPDRDGRILAGEIELRTPLIHDPATASWGGWGTRSSVAVSAAPTDAFHPAHGTWSFTAGQVRLTPFRPLSPAQQEAVDHEISRLLPFLTHR